MKSIWNPITKTMTFPKKPQIVSMKATDILELLARRHKDDVFVPSCKNGPTYTNKNLRILDAWVLLKTYSPLTTIGYEIKVGRQDFLNDKKWTQYLGLCHLFYFVCPKGLIEPSEIPSRIGLIEAVDSKLYTRKRSERIEPDIKKQYDLLIYILMSRATLKREF